MPREVFVLVSVWEKPLHDLKLCEFDVHLWIANLDDYFARIKYISKYLSDDEIKKADRYYSVEHGYRYRIGRGLLRILLAYYVKNKPNTFKFIYNSYGKPFLENSKINFNISHSKNIAVYAFSLIDDIGVDVEYIDSQRATFEIANRFFSKQEVEKLQEINEHDRIMAFYYCWTRKEAYIKAKGQGLSIPLDSFSVDITLQERSSLNMSKLCAQDVANVLFYSFEPFPNFVSTLSVPSKIAKISCNSIMNDILNDMQN